MMSIGGGNPSPSKQSRDNKESDEGQKSGEGKEGKEGREGKEGKEVRESKESETPRKSEKSEGSEAHETLDTSETRETMESVTSTNSDILKRVHELFEMSKVNNDTIQEIKKTCSSSSVSPASVTSSPTVIDDSKNEDCPSPRIIKYTLGHNPNVLSSDTEDSNNSKKRSNTPINTPTNTKTDCSSSDDDSEDIEHISADRKLLFVQNNCPIYASDLDCLRPTIYLNDNIIGWYMDLVRNVQSQLIMTFSTFLVSKMMACRSTAAVEELYLTDLIKWHRGKNIFEKPLWLIPTHRSLHWFLAVVIFMDHPAWKDFDPKTDNDDCVMMDIDANATVKSTNSSEAKKYGLSNGSNIVICIMDSLQSNRRPYDSIFNRIRQYIALEAEHKLKIKVNHQSIPSCILPSPQQPNGYDCGLSFLNNAHLIASNLAAYRTFITSILLDGLLQSNSQYNSQYNSHGNHNNNQYNIHSNIHNSRNISLLTPHRGSNQSMFSVVDLECPDHPDTIDLDDCPSASATSSSSMGSSSGRPARILRNNPQTMQKISESVSNLTNDSDLPSCTQAMATHIHSSPCTPTRTHNSNNNSNNSNSSNDAANRGPMNAVSLEQQLRTSLRQHKLWYPVNDLINMRRNLIDCINNIHAVEIENYKEMMRNSSSLGQSIAVSNASSPQTSSRAHNGKSDASTGNKAVNDVSTVPSVNEASTGNRAVNDASTVPSVNDALSSTTVLESKVSSETVTIDPMEIKSSSELLANSIAKSSIVNDDTTVISFYNPSNRIANSKESIINDTDDEDISIEYDCMNKGTASKDSKNKGMTSDFSDCKDSKTSVIVVGDSVSSSSKEPVAHSPSRPQQQVINMVNVHSSSPSSQYHDAQGSSNPRHFIDDSSHSIQSNSIAGQSMHSDANSMQPNASSMQSTSSSHAAPLAALLGCELLLDDPLSMDANTLDAFDLQNQSMTSQSDILFHMIGQMGMNFDSQYMNIASSSNDSQVSSSLVIPDSLSNTKSDSQKQSPLIDHPSSNSHAIHDASSTHHSSSNTMLNSTKETITIDDADAKESSSKSIPSSSTSGPSPSASEHLKSLANGSLAGETNESLDISWS